MRRVLFSLIILFCLPFSFAQLNLSSTEQKDNFSLYLLGVQSELLGDYSSAQRLYDLSYKRSDSKAYIPSLLKNINLRLISGDYSTETENLINLANSSEIDDSTLLLFMKLDFSMGKKDYVAARKLCNEFIKNNSNNPKIHEVLAIIDYSTSKLDSALLKINDYESSFGISSSLYSIKRQILAQMGLYDSLLQYNARISDLYPENLQILADLANVNTALGNDSIAYQQWNFIESEDPNSLEFLIQSNSFYSTRRYKEETIKTATKLLSSPFIIPTAKDQFFKSIFMAIDITKDTSYLPRLDTLLLDIAFSEKDTTIVQDLVLSYLFYRNDFKKSFQLLDSMILNFPELYECYLQKASLLNYMGDGAGALQVLDEAILLYPHIPNIVLYKAELLKKSSQQDAIKYLNAVIKTETVDTTKSHYITYIADIYYTSNKLSKAFKLYEDALSLYPENANTLNNYAYFLAVSDKNLERALVLSHKCNSLVSNNPTYLDTEAYILYKLGMYNEAKEKMDLAFSQESDSFSDELYLHYADILKALGNVILARNYYQKALDAGADANKINERLEALEKR